MEYKRLRGLTRKERRELNRIVRKQRKEVRRHGEPLPDAAAAAADREGTMED